MSLVHRMYSKPPEQKAERESEKANNTTTVIFVKGAAFLGIPFDRQRNKPSPVNLPMVFVGPLIGSTWRSPVTTS